MDPGFARDPQVAVDGGGNAVAVWVQLDGTVSSMWASWYVVGSGWGTASLLENDNVGVVESPQVAVDRTGNAVAVWTQPNATEVNVWASRYTAGWGWGTATQLDTAVGDARGPQVAVDADGNALAVWYQFDGSWFSIWANRYAPSSGWGTAALIETSDTSAAAAPQLAFDAGGNAIAVWQQGDGTWDNVWANRYDSRSGWGRATLIETEDSFAGAAQVALDGAGNAVAVWMAYDGVRYNVWQNIYTAASGWGTAGLLETENAGHSGAPQVAIDGNGNAMAVWYQGDGSRYNVWATRYDAKSGWGTAALIETDNLGDASMPDVAVDPSGNAVAVWYQSDGVRSNHWANRYVAGLGWGGATLIETDNAGAATNPQVAVDGQGDAVVVWQQSNGVRQDILSNRFVSVDVTPPSIAISSPAPASITNQSSAWIAGTAEAGATVSVNGVAATVGTAGAFGLIVALQSGVNVIVATAWDSSGNSASASVSVNFTDPVAALEAQLAAAQANVTAAQSNLAALTAIASATQAQLDAARANLTAAQGRMATLEAQAASTRDQLNATRADLTAAQARVTALESNSSAANADGAITQAQSDSAAGQVGLALMLAVAGIAIGLVGTLLAIRKGSTTVVKVPDSPPPSPPK